MYEKLFMSAKFWHQDVKVSHLQKSTRTFVFKKAKIWTSTWHCLLNDQGRDGISFEFLQIIKQNIGTTSVWISSLTVLKCCAPDGGLDNGCLIRWRIQESGFLTIRNYSYKTSPGSGLKQETSLWWIWFNILSILLCISMLTVEDLIKRYTEGDSQTL